MLCCLLALAALAPLGVMRAGEQGDCCAGKRRGLKIAAMVLSIAAIGATVSMLLQPEPFHHICRFIVSRT